MNFCENGVTGHRGNPQDFPQNTLVSFESAISLGCDWVETDIRLTGDGHVVLSHDGDTRSEADKFCVIGETPLGELRRLNMAARFNMSHTERTPLFASMPTLEEALELFRSQDKVRLSLQPKVPGALEAAEKIIRQMKFPEEMLGFNDGNLQYMIAARKAFPGAEIFYDRLKCDELANDIKTARKHRFENLVYNECFLNFEAVTKVLEAGLTPGVWTVCNPGEMDRFIAMNVKRFYTDFPAELLKKLDVER